MTTEEIVNSEATCSPAETQKMQTFAGMVADACMKVFREEQKKMEWKSIRERETRDRLKSYRRVKKSLKDKSSMPSDDEAAEMRWKCLEDLIGKPDSYLDKTIEHIGNREKAIRQSGYSVWQIDRALKLYADEVDKFGNEDDKRRYRVLYAAYISDQRLAMQAIADEENINVRTAYKDIDAAISIVSVYLFGF